MSISIWTTLISQRLQTLREIYLKSKIFNKTCKIKYGKII